MEKRRVVITGLGTVNPTGNTVADSWAAVRRGVVRRRADYPLRYHQQQGQAGGGGQGL